MSIKEKIINILETNCDMKNIHEYLDNNDDLTEIGINSISFIKMVVELENEFDLEFEDEALDYNKFISLDVLCKYVVELLGRKS